MEERADIKMKYERALLFIQQHPRLSMTGGTATTALLVDLLAQGGWYGLIGGAAVTAGAWRYGPGFLQSEPKAKAVESRPSVGRVDQQSSERTFMERMKRLFDSNANGPHDPIRGIVKEEPRERQEIVELEDVSVVPSFKSQEVKTEASIRRLTIEQIVSHIEPNSFKIYIGRSLTKPGNPPVQVGFYKQHFKFIGASQRGKSAMAAAFLDIVTRTHDPEHVLIALLDLEDQTSRLFADLPHVAEVATDKGTYPLYARSHEEVLHRLRLIMLIMDERYSMDKSQVLQEPILLVYVEEFLALKDYFKNLISGKTGEAKKQAEKEYADLIFCISEIARRGLKVRIQLLLCAQVNYRDEDLQEALVNVVAGLSYAVLPTAAQAAGFYDHEMLKRCARNDKVGEAVAQMPDCKDLVLAPEYDLEQKLIDLEKADAMRGQKKVDSILTAKNGHKQADARNGRGLRPDEDIFDGHFDTRDFTRNDQSPSSEDEEDDFGIYAQENNANGLVERTQQTQELRYVLDRVQTEMFCVAYELTGNIDESLKRTGAHSGYRNHARQVIAERGLKGRK